MPYLVIEHCNRLFPSSDSGRCLACPPLGRGPVLARLFVCYRGCGRPCCHRCTSPAPPCRPRGDFLCTTRVSKFASSDDVSKFEVHTSAVHEAKQASWRLAAHSLRTPGRTQGFVNAQGLIPVARSESTAPRALRKQASQTYPWLCPEASTDRQGFLTRFSRPVSKTRSTRLSDNR
jgi:hypothetical protein